MTTPASRVTAEKSEVQHTPGPWSVGYRALNVQAPSEKGGTFPVCDIRGWGYLTGNGHGALGLPADEAVAIQEANARLIAAAPELLEALKDAKFALYGNGWANPKMEAAIAKAEGRS